MYPIIPVLDPTFLISPTPIEEIWLFLWVRMGCWLRCWKIFILGFRLFLGKKSSPSIAPEKISQKHGVSLFYLTKTHQFTGSTRGSQLAPQLTALQLYLSPTTLTVLCVCDTSALKDSISGGSVNDSPLWSQDFDAAVEISAVSKFPNQACNNKR